MRRKIKDERPYLSDVMGCDGASGPTFSPVLCSISCFSCEPHPPGESVPVEEQLSSKHKKSSSESSAVTDSLAPPPAPLSDEEKAQYETLITSLYQQLDDKVSPSYTCTHLSVLSCEVFTMCCTMC